jgi:hypothetical protein
LSIEAAKKLKSQVKVPDLILIDEGYDAARRIQCNPELNTNPVCKRLETRAVPGASNLQ